MSHLTWEYSIIIGEETKNVNENGVQVDKHGPYKHFSTSKNLKLSLSRFGRIENACYNEITIE